MDRSRSDRVLEEWDMLSKDAPRPPLPPRDDRSGPPLLVAAITLAAVIIVAVAAGAIWISRPSDGTGQSASPTGSTAVVSPTASPSATPTQTPSATPTPSVTPPVTASPEPTDALGPFTCSLPLTRAGTAAGAQQGDPTDVRVGTHDGYDRIVFEYSGSATPTLTIETVQPPFTHDPSDLPMTVAGSAFLRIKLEGVLMGGYTGATDFKPNYPALVELAQQGDFEGIQTWIVGLTKTSCVRVIQLNDPTRLVIDIEQ